jgi:hypothetical protein
MDLEQDIAESRFLGMVEPLLPAGHSSCSIAAMGALTRFATERRLARPMGAYGIIEFAA